MARLTRAKRSSMSPAEKERKDLKGPKRVEFRPRKQNKRETVALVDAEIIVYQACADCTVEERVGDEYTWTLDKRAALNRAVERVEQASREIGATDIVLAAGSVENWRKRICETYKANRAGKKKPLGYGDVIEALGLVYRLERKPRLEADDVLGILMTGEFEDRGVIVSNDKDMLTVPGRHYNPSDPNPKIVSVDAERAEIEHAVLALAGDSADGYKGCRGVGEKGARDALSSRRSNQSVWQAALEQFRKAGHDEAYALQQFRISYVMRDGDLKGDVVKLWGPTTHGLTKNGRR